MGKHVGSFASLICCTCLPAFISTARSQVYVNADVGGTLAQKVEVKSLNGAAVAPGVKFDFEPGVRAGVAVGYNFNPIVGLEFESGFIYNNMKNVAGPGGTVGLDASLSHVPLQVNMVFRYDEPTSPWVIFFGGGAGGDASMVWDNAADESATKFIFAWQAFGGFRYKFNESMSFGAGYKYYSAHDTTFNLNSESFGVGPQNSHSILLEFNVKF